MIYKMFQLSDYFMTSYFLLIISFTFGLFNVAPRSKIYYLDKVYYLFCPPPLKKGCAQDYTECFT